MIICVFLVEMGSDARLFAVKLVKFASQKYAKKKINSGILKLCKSLVDIISICYINCSQRTQKKFCAFTIRASCSAFSAKPLLKIPRRWQLENLWMSLPLHDSACSADTSDFLPPLISTGARGAVILWPETHIPKYFKSTVWQGYRECYFRIQYPTTNWQRGELSKTGNYHKSASKITATVRGHQIFIRNLTKYSLLIPDSLPENCWFSARGTKHLVVHTGKEYCISRWHFSSWAALK